MKLIKIIDAIKSLVPQRLAAFLKKQSENPEIVRDLMVNNYIVG